MTVRHDVLTARPKRDEGTWWHKIGTAFQAKDGGMNVILDSLPIPDKDGKVSFIIREAKDLRESSGTGQRRAPMTGQRQATQAPIDDDVPF